MPPLALISIPGGGTGPAYAFTISAYETTNDQYCTFLNDAQRDGGLTEKGQYMSFLPSGRVETGSGLLLFRTSNDAGTASRIAYNPLRAKGARYQVQTGFGTHPVTSVSWIGSVKFCNWLTLASEMPPSQRCYTEGPLAEDWHPVPISSADWAVRDLNASERIAWLELAGFRLPMDSLDTDTAIIAGQDNAYNEWYKAIAHNPGSTGGIDENGVAFPAGHNAYGFGSNTISGAHANYQALGLFNDDAPVGLFIGEVYNPGGGGPLGNGAELATIADLNTHGLYDMSGNVSEWLSDHVSTSAVGIARRPVRGGSYASPSNELAASYRGAGLTVADTSAQVGFRVVNVPYEIPSISGTLAEQLLHAFSQIGLQQVPSGVLLDLGAIFNGGLIQMHDGASAEPVTSGQLLEMAGDLARSSISQALPDVPTLYAHANALRQDGHAPLTLLACQYDKIDPKAFSDGRILLEGEFFKQASPPGQSIWAPGLCVAATLLGGLVPEGTRSVILDDDLMFTNPGIAIGAVQLQFAGSATAYTLTPGTPVQVLVPPADGGGQLNFVVTFTVNGVLYQSFGKTSANQATAQCCDCVEMPIVVAATAHLGVAGKLNVRIIPSAQTLGSIPLPALATCPNNGRWNDPFPYLCKPVVFLPGIDITNDQTLDDVWEFDDTLLNVMRDKGYDIILVDYVDGNTYVERNGWAVRELLTKVTTWMKPGFECAPITVVGKSMGTQTGAFGIRKAELGGGPNVRAFICHDGPFRGANLAAGVGGILKKLAPFSTILSLINNGFGLVAARQLTEFYNTDPLRPAYVADMNALGLPVMSRNVGIASGSGNAVRMNHNPNSASVVAFSKLDKTWYFPVLKVTIFPPSIKIVYTVAGGIHVRVNSDNNGRILEFNMVYLGFGGAATVALNNAHYVDLAPGGFHRAPKIVAEAYNASSFESLTGPMTYDLDRFSFVPTFSSLAITTGSTATDLTFNPSAVSPATLYASTPFDKVYFGETDNTAHVQNTAKAIQAFGMELDAVSALFNADCDSDGIPNYVEIHCGGAPDTNHNGIPDGCETLPWGWPWNAALTGPHSQGHLPQ
jgi:hypothetical protein